MEWLTVEVIETSENYTFTPVVTGSLFKLKHISQSTAKNSLKVAIRQAIYDNGELALFDYKLINCKTEQEIILFNLPQGLTNRRLAIKRIDNLSDVWTIEIKTLVNGANNMPAYPASPISNSRTAITTENMVAVDNIQASILSAYSPTKLGTTIINKSTSYLLVRIGGVATLTDYDKILGTDEVFETPFNWCGEVYGILDRADGSEGGAYAKVKDFG